MPAHSIGSALISFGLVSIPIKLYTATASAGVSFNLLHAKCGHRIRQQMWCPGDNEIVERSGLVKGYEVAKDQYVRVTDEELRALEGEASKIIDIAEFVPLPRVDPIYFERTYYLGPGKGGEKAYRLLAEAMAKTERVALATFVMRGKESLVLIRPAQHGLMLHTMYFADEVRDFGEIDKGETAKIREGELELAVRLIDELSHEEFTPDQYQDDYQRRVLDLVHSKVEGKAVTAAGPEVQRIHVVDLMDALKQSLAQRAAPAPTPGAPPAPLPKKPPVKGGSARHRRQPREAGQEGSSEQDMITPFTTVTREGATIVELPSPSYRTVEHFAPTLIVDEADTFLLNNLALRGVINSGHTRATAFVVRTAGHEPRLFSTWGARMIALIGRLPATLEDRAIVLPMRRRAPGEAVDRIRRDGLLNQCDPLRRRAARWVADHLPALRAADPVVPETLDDRQADNWRPLLAIADEARGVWPALARTAARTLAGAVVEADTTAPVRLLADLRDLFATTTADRLATAAIIRHLTALDDRPWADDAQGRPLTPRHLAKLLEGFRIKAKQIRQGADTRKGYLRADFTDAFQRYLPPDPKHPKHPTGTAA